MDIRLIKLEDIPSQIVIEGKREGLIFRNSDNALYFGGFFDSNLVTIGCLVIHKNKHATIKTNYTLKEHRRKGFFSKLNTYMLKYARESNIDIIILNCLRGSVNIHLRCGARVWKTTKNISWMIYDKGTF